MKVSARWLPLIRLLERLGVFREVPAETLAHTHQGMQVR